MPFEWNSVGPGPAADQIEVAIFGPGFGECIVIHVGGGQWLVVDSCTDQSDSSSPLPVAERYLRAIGVAPEIQVTNIVATHWHDDHVRGLGRLVEVCRGATFSCANALLKNEFIAYIREMATGYAATEGAKVKEINQVFRTLAADPSRITRYAMSARALASWQNLPHGKKICLRSLSPSDTEFELFLKYVAVDRPQAGTPKRAASGTSPNLTSVVLHLDFEVGSVLLGADMEIHSDPKRGWSAVVDDAKISGTSSSSLFKVAHHGSSNGHHNQMWQDMLTTQPISVVTPFSKLPIGKKLPTEEDIARIQSYGRLFLTSERWGKGANGTRDAAVDRSLRENGIVTRDLRTSLGMVRMRRRPAASESGWSTEVFSPAHEVARQAAPRR